MLYERYEPQDWGDYVGHAPIVARLFLAPMVNLAKNKHLIDTSQCPGL